jgi:hypothetical protein
MVMGKYLTAEGYQQLYEDVFYWIVEYPGDPPVWDQAAEVLLKAIGSFCKHPVGSHPDQLPDLALLLKRLFGQNADGSARRLPGAVVFAGLFDRMVDECNRGHYANTRARDN